MPTREIEVSADEVGVWGVVVASDLMREAEARIAASASPGAGAAELWESVEATPLWERDPDVADAWRVTFLWRGEPELTRHVTLCGPAVLGETSANGGWRFEHIAGTDVWHLTLRVPAQTRSAYAISPNGRLGAPAELADWVWLQATWVRDPLNPGTFVIPASAEAPAWTPRVFSLIEAPDAPAQRWRVVQPGVERGKLVEHAFTSAALQTTRTVWTYTPVGWTSDDQCPLLLAFDAWEAITLNGLPTVLDNLIAAGEIPPVVAVLVGNETVEGRGRELDCDEQFLTYLADELLPWANDRWSRVPDRSKTLIAGESLGGRAAVFSSLRRPDVFGKALAQAVAVTETGELAIDAFVDKTLPRASEQLVEFYLEVGLLEIDSSGDKAFLPGVRRLRDYLRAAGHEVHHAELPCGHDDPVFAESVADGLRVLLRDASESAD